MTFLLLFRLFVQSDLASPVESVSTNHIEEEVDEEAVNLL